MRRQPFDLCRFMKWQREIVYWLLTLVLLNTIYVYIIYTDWLCTRFAFNFSIHHIWPYWTTISHWMLSLTVWNNIPSERSYTQLWNGHLVGFFFPIHKGFFRSIIPPGVPQCVGTSTCRFGNLVTSTESVG